MKVFRIIPEFRILRLTFNRTPTMKVSLKMLNSAGNNSFSDLVSVYLNVLTIKLGIFDNLEAYSKF